jgi:predicted SprT family Zn-dependent metalloprotease
VDKKGQVDAAEGGGAAGAGTHGGTWRIAKGWTFGFDRATQRFGYCHWPDKRITLSAALTQLNSEEEVRETGLHEIAHAGCPEDRGHGPPWKAKARALGCSSTRCYADRVKTPAPSYVGTCPGCGSHIWRHRRVPIACGRCSPGVYDERYRLEWARAHPQQLPLL